MRISILFFACAALPVAIGCRSSTDNARIKAEPPPNRYSFSSPGLFPEGNLGARGVAPEGGVVELKTAAQVALRGEPGEPLDGKAVFLAPEYGGEASKLVVVVNHGSPGTYEVHLASSCATMIEQSLRGEDTRIGELVVDDRGQGMMEAVVATAEPLDNPAIMVRRQADDRRVNLIEGTMPGMVACSVMPVPVEEPTG